MNIKYLLKITTLLGAFALVMLVIFLANLPWYKAWSLKTSYVQVKPRDEVSANFIVTPSRPARWVSVDQIAHHLKNAIVVSEDWSFYEHNGVDSNQIWEALQESFVEGKKLRGASTITQQLVKNVLLSSQRSYIRKLKEVILARFLNLHLSKERILELYLNIVHLGEKIYGIEAASRYYFDKAARSLSPKEAAFLAMLLPSPLRYSQSYRDRELTPFAKKIIDSILEKMAIAKYLTHEQAEFAKNQYLSWEVRKSPVQGGEFSQFYDE